MIQKCYVESLWNTSITKVELSKSEVKRTISKTIGKTCPSKNPSLEINKIWLTKDVKKWFKKLNIEEM